jgi:hypothetical protein
VELRPDGLFDLEHRRPVVREILKVLHVGGDVGALRCKRVMEKARSALGRSCFSMRSTSVRQDAKPAMAADTSLTTSAVVLACSSDCVS